jgi:hypothetical protein
VYGKKPYLSRFPSQPKKLLRILQIVGTNSGREHQESHEEDDDMERIDLKYN